MSGVHIAAVSVAVTAVFTLHNMLRQQQKKSGCRGGGGGEGRGVFISFSFFLCTGEHDAKHTGKD